MVRVLIKQIAVKLIPVLLLIMWSDALYAQRPLNGGGSNRDQLGISNMNSDQTRMQAGVLPGVVDNNAPPEDTTAKVKPPKPRKPLESYFFDDSLRARRNFVWTVDMDKNRISEVVLDTMLQGFQVDYPFLQNSVGAIHLGNLGGPSIPLSFFSRPQYQDFIFASVFDAYFTNPERARFFNTKKPFTHLTYFFAGQTRKLEENLRATHAQNVSPSTGFNLDYQSRGTKGFYLRQKARNKNLSMAISHTGKQYTAHAGYIYNMADVNENGGIVRDRDITDTVFELPELIDVRLMDANNRLKNNIFYAVQSYGIPLRRISDEDFSIADRSTIFFGHSIRYSRMSKVYSDTKAGSGDKYENWFINSQKTYDSIFESLISNRLFMQIQPFDRNGVIGLIDAGIGNDMHQFYQFRLNDYLKKGSSEKKSGTFIYGSIDGHLRRYLSWGANLKYNLFGFRNQDMSMGANIALSAFIKDHPITLRGSVSNELRSPDYWVQSFFSNHFVWDNSFSKETETRLNVSLEVPHINVELGVHQSVITDKIYYNADMVPAQYSGTVSVSGLYAKKDFHLGGFQLNHRVLLQWSTVEEVVPVPLASVYLSYLYEFNLVRDVLRLQIGVDGRYNTKFYAFGYNPAIAQFYNQREKKLGAYPMLDVFVAAKWKRMRILVKLQHMNEDLFGERNYFSALHYPLNKRVLKFGFSWTFYD